MSEHIAAASEALENAEQEATIAGEAAQAASLAASQAAEAAREAERVAQDGARQETARAHQEAAETVSQNEEGLAWLRERMEIQETKQDRILGMLEALALIQPTISQPETIAEEVTVSTIPPASVVADLPAVEPEPSPPKKLRRFRLI